MGPARPWPTGRRRGRLVDPDLEHDGAPRRQDAAAHRQRLPGRLRGHPRHHRVRGEVRASLRARAARIRASRYRADWRRSDRNRPAIAPVKLPHKNWARSANPSARAFSRAIASAAGLMSMPMPDALGSSDSSASSRQPVPVPMSAICSAREREPLASIAPSAASTTVSVSGLGTKVALLTCSGRPQNSLQPMIAATLSRASRRSARAAICCASRA